MRHDLRHSQTGCDHRSVIYIPKTGGKEEKGSETKLTFKITETDAKDGSKLSNFNSMPSHKMLKHDFS